MDTSGIVSFEAVSPIFESLANQISVSNVIAILASIAGLCIGGVFMWWAVRKGTKALMKSFKSGKFGL